MAERKVNKKVCRRCVMDSTDPAIAFDENGFCNHCRNFFENTNRNWEPTKQGYNKLLQIAEVIKKSGKKREYDCTIGISGGIDSSYLMYIAKEKLGLRPLAVHVDCGWNSDEAVSNIRNLLEKLDVELFTYVVNWEEMKDLQRSYLKAALANQDVPQDHAIFGKLYEFSVANKVNYVLTGSNIATESILPPYSWGYNALDLRNMLSIQRKFGKVKLKTFPKVPMWKYYFYYPFVKKMQIIKPLNYLPYNKEEAIEFLKENLGWRYYGGKHYESRFTKFFQAYYLPAKFGYDKRKAHLSSLIVTGQLSRDSALGELRKPLYEKGKLEEDINYICKKLSFSPGEFDEIMKLPIKTFSDYSNNDSFFRAVAFIRSFLRVRFGK